jgi:release factor glutamine methyltransferase
VLDPRADTETLVAAAVETLRDRRNDPLRILDLGTGSGALLCALLSEFPQAFGVAADRDARALGIARENLAACGFAARSALLCGDWGDALGQAFDLIVSNPPYVRSADIASLAPEVRDYDPRAALDGGPDGLLAYRAIAADLRRLAAPDGIAIVEIGFDQAESAAKCFRQAGWASIAVRRDLENQPRALLVRR